jgi:uncharacterized Zn-binding protein involved in type VI secretion
MPGWARQGDINSAAAPITGGTAATVIVNNKSAAIVGSFCPPHPVMHGQSPIIAGISTVICENKPAAPSGAPYACGHVQTQASIDVIIGT